MTEPSPPTKASAPVDAAPVTEVGDGVTEHDVARRAFFKDFGRQAITTVGQVAGMANIVSRPGTSAAASLLGKEPWDLLEQ